MTKEMLIKEIPNFLKFIKEVQPKMEETFPEMTKMIKTILEIGEDAFKNGDNPEFMLYMASYLNEMMGEAVFRISQNPNSPKDKHVYCCIGITRQFIIWVFKNKLNQGLKNDFKKRSH